MYATLYHHTAWIWLWRRLERRPKLILSLTPTRYFFPSAWSVSRQHILTLLTLTSEFITIASETPCFFISEREYHSARLMLSNDPLLPNLRRSLLPLHLKRGSLRQPAMRDPSQVHYHYCSLLLSMYLPIQLSGTRRRGANGVHCRGRWTLTVLPIKHGRRLDTTRRYQDGGCMR